jgi:hypothetical protein
MHHLFILELLNDLYEHYNLQKWQEESDRMREKLLSLIGRIGRDGREPKTTTRVRSKYRLLIFNVSIAKNFIIIYN